MRLSNFFKYPSSWSKGAAARDKDGRPINLNKFPHNPFKGQEIKIESLSLAGAVSHLLSQERDGDRRSIMLDKLSKAIQIHTGKKFYVEEFNDLNTTTFEDIKKVIKIAENL
jgi:hypothetical protein